MSSRRLRRSPTGRSLAHDLVGARGRSLPRELDRTWPERTRRSPKLTSSFYLPLSALTESLVAARDRYLRAPVEMLDIGCGARPYYPVFAELATDYVGADLAPGPGVRYVGPAERLGAPDASFDVALATQMLEHVRDPVQCLAEIRRVLRPGGLALITTHGVWPYHPVPNDYWRWTHEGLHALIEDVGGLQVLEIVPHRSTAACLATLIAYFVQLAADGTVWDRLGAYAVAAVNALGVLLDRGATRATSIREHDLILNYLVIARRVG